jgi:alkylation response protein AidB-like acyl-CoA dehydrogenase
MGKTATHGVVFARLISLGKDHGVQAFIIQLRDMETGKTLPGIEAGDIGPKITGNANDNGYLIFKNYHSPKSSLLDRYVKLDD